MPPDQLHAARAVHEAVGIDWNCRVRQHRVVARGILDSAAVQGQLVGLDFQAVVAESPTATVYLNTTSAPLL